MFSLLPLKQVFFLQNLFFKKENPDFYPILQIYKKGFEEKKLALKAKEKTNKGKRKSVKKYEKEKNGVNTAKDFEIKLRERVRIKNIINNCGYKKYSIYEKNRDDIAFDVKRNRKRACFYKAFKKRRDAIKYRDAWFKENCPFTYSCLIAKKPLFYKILDFFRT